MAEGRHGQRLGQALGGPHRQAGLFDGHVELLRWNQLFGARVRHDVLIQELIGELFHAIAEAAFGQDLIASAASQIRSFGDDLIAIAHLVAERPGRRADGKHLENRPALFDGVQDIRVMQVAELGLALDRDDDDHAARRLALLDPFRQFEEGLEEIGPAARASEEAADSLLEQGHIARVLDERRRTVAIGRECDLRLSVQLLDELGQRVAHELDGSPRRLAVVDRHRYRQRFGCRDGAQYLALDVVLAHAEVGGREPGDGFPLESSTLT